MKFFFFGVGCGFGFMSMEFMYIFCAALQPCNEDGMQMFMKFSHAT